MNGAKITLRENLLMKRYAPQMILPEVGKLGQKKLSQSRVLCVGVGGLGSPITLYLAAAGVGTLGIADDDEVDISNLQRQILFNESDLGQPKAKLAASRLQKLNSSIQIFAHQDRIALDNVLDVLSQYDLVIDATDNFKSKYLINDTSARLGIPVIFGSISGFEGRVSVFWSKYGACYRCLYPSPPRSLILDCNTQGVLGALAGIIGSIQALEAIKVLLSLKREERLNCLLNQLFVFDALEMKSSVFQINKRADCKLCHLPPEQITIEEVNFTCAVDHFNPSLEIDQPSFKAELEKGTLRLIDVREKQEWDDGHLPHSINLPLSQIHAGKISILVTLSGKKIVLYCKDGIRSQMALEILNSSGINLVNLYHLKGGARRWNGEWVTSDEDF